MRYDFRPVAACNMCGSSQLKMLGMRLSSSQGLSPRKAKGVAVPVKQCVTCGLIFAGVPPVPERLADHNGIPPEDCWGDIPEWTPDYFSRQIAAAKRLIDFQPGMKALDIGVGSGGAVLSLEHADFEAWGLEPSEPFRISQ